MPKVSEITNCQFICEKLDDFLYYGHTVEHRWILQINLSVLLGVIMHVQALPKCCETTNHQFWERVKWLCYFFVCSQTAMEAKSAWACPNYTELTKLSDCLTFCMKIDNDGSY